MIDTEIIAPLDLELFRIIAKKIGLDAKEIVPSVDIVNVCFDASLMSNNFGMNITYEAHLIKLCWLTWDGGISTTKGYATTESDLIQDKNYLTRIVTKEIGKLPDKKSYNHDIFLFDWGYLSTSAPLQSTIASIGISWNARLKCES